MSDRIAILRNAYRKLDQLPLSFGMKNMDECTDAEIEKFVGGDLNDALREIRMKDTGTIEEMSLAELRIENRVVYHTLRRFRNSASVDFKYNTGSDGKMVDKTDIPKMLAKIIGEYDDEFKLWRKTLYTGGNWSRSASNIPRTTDMTTTGTTTATE